MKGSATFLDSAQVVIPATVGEMQDWLNAGDSQPGTPVWLGYASFFFFFLFDKWTRIDSECLGLSQDFSQTIPSLLRFVTFVSSSLPTGL